MGLIDMLVRKRRHRYAQALLALSGVELPPGVSIGRDFRLVHRGVGTVIHPKTVIGDRVRIYHQVTVGRADAHLPMTSSRMEQVVIGDDVVLFPGVKVLAGPGTTTLGAGTIVAANAVLTTSTGEWEIWGGVPARKIGDRDDRPDLT